MAWFREGPDVTLEQLVWGDAPAVEFAATLVRAALAAVPADVTGRRCPSCGNPFDGDNLCMPSACQWEGTEEEPARSVSPDDVHTETVTEWRVTATMPKGERVEFWHRAERPALDQAAHYRRWAWSDVRVESRTVSTSRRESEWKATDQ